MARPPWWATWSTGSLGMLLFYMIAREIVEPGFTHYWGYMVAQIAATIVIVISLEKYFRPEGGLSWLTYAVVMIATWADTLGTAGHLYDRYRVYDKIIHFGGGVAITAVSADLLFAHRRKRGLPQQLTSTLVIAALMSFTLTTGWEVYEYLGDRVFSTGRHAGWLDTTYDMISDAAGSFVALALLALIEPRRFDRDNRPIATRRSQPSAVEPTDSVFASVSGGSQDEPPSTRHDQPTP